MQNTLCSPFWSLEMAEKAAGVSWLWLCRRLLLVEALRPQAGGDAAEALVDPARERCCPECGSVRLLYAEIPRPERLMRCTADSS